MLRRKLRRRIPADANWKRPGNSRQAPLPYRKETKRIVLNTRMSDYGYWVVEIGTASAQHVSIMVCKVGITPQEAETLALSGVEHALEQVGKA